MDHFSIDPWLESLAECGLSAEAFTGARELDAPLPWDHLNAGYPEFLLRNAAAPLKERFWKTAAMRLPPVRSLRYGGGDPASPHTRT